MTDLHARIAVRAFYAWKAAGRPEGQHEAHWLAAERIEVAETLRAAAERVACEAFDAAAIERAAKRRAAALKAAATRKANKAAAESRLTAAMGARLGRIASRDAAGRHAAH